MSSNTSNKIDEILYHVMALKEDVAAIKEKINSLDEKVEKQDKEIEYRKIENQEIDGKVRKMEIKTAMYIGGLTVVWFIGQLLIERFFLG